MLKTLPCKAILAVICINLIGYAVSRTVKESPSPANNGFANGTDEAEPRGLGAKFCALTGLAWKYRNDKIVQNWFSRLRNNQCIYGEYDVLKFCLGTNPECYPESNWLCFYYKPYLINKSALF